MQEGTNLYMVATYLSYLALSLGVTVWVARKLFKNGQVFLVDAFLGKERLADSVNQLLVVGFYLINVGFVALALKDHETIHTVQGAIERVASKMGLVLLVLGGMHFFNLLVFSRIRRRGQQHNEPPPILPREFIPNAVAPVVARSA
jgi:cytochrome c biogenesis protein CcdA